MKALDTVITPIHPEGRAFVLVFAAVSLLAFLIWDPLGWSGLVLTAWCYYFFRDPERVIPAQDGVLVSPADGTVSAITEASPPPELDMGDAPMTRVSIFLNVFNVHINRTPIEGRVGKLVYVPGLFVNAAEDKASEVNERQLIRIDPEGGDSVAVALVAGLVARRILCSLTDAQTVSRGERMALIRFGSRADIWVPKDMDLSVSVGQTMIGGETIVANKR